MPVNISLQGADYPDVPKVLLPKTGGGSAEFYYDITPMIIRPDAEKLATYTYDKWAVADEEITLPTYSTSAQTIMASANLEPTITLDYNTYNYYIIERMVAIPKYSVTTKAKGRVEYYLGAYNYEIATVPGGTFVALLNGTTNISGRSVITGSVNIGRLFYWSSSSAVSLYSSTSTGLYMTPVAPTISSSVLTLKSPTCGTKGSGTYFSSTYANALTDVRFQYVFEVWRAPRNHMNIDGFGLEQSYRHMAACINTETHTLT